MQYGLLALRAYPEKHSERKTQGQVLLFALHHESMKGKSQDLTLCFSHIPQRWATEINAFNRKYLNPYINYHRPCFFPKTIADKQG